MKAEFWQARWMEGRIGFHKSAVNPLLTKYFDKLKLEKGSRVLVPLAGKSVDMAWLAQQGYEVVGIELIESAVEQFFAEQGIMATVTQPCDNDDIRCYQAELAGQTLTLWVADIFALTAKDIGRIDAVYDRAALIALPENTRRQYSEQIVKLSSNDNKKAAAQLLITIHYDQSQKDGPPFSISAEQVQQYYSSHYKITELEDKPSTLNANSELAVTEHVWLLTPILNK